MDKDKQMEFLFEEGGIADDGMNRDPISGNEVPPGSLAEEVRDDIPAALSEGEYVVPADVVRYYGVKFFEDLRSQAKEGLGEMDRDGRIGGEPIDMEEELSPEERAEIASMMGMAIGGMVSQQPMQPVDPYMQQANLYRAPEPVVMGNTMQQRAFQEGGSVTEADTQVQFDPMDFRAGFTFARPEQRPQATTVILYGPNGEVRNVLFPSEEYNRLIAEGYSTQQGTASVTPEVSPEVTDEGGDSRVGYTTFSGDEPRDLSELSVEELQSNLRGLDTMSRIGGALAIAVNPMFGLAARAALAANRNNLVEELTRRGVDMSDYREEYGRDIFGGGISMYDGLQDQPGSRSGVDFGDTWLGDALGFDGKLGVQGPGLKESREGERRSFDSTPATTTTTSQSDSSDNDSFTSSITEAQKSKSKAVQEGSQAAAGKTTAGRDIQSEKYSGKGYTGGRAEGGFISRRNKKNKK